MTSRADDVNRPPSRIRYAWALDSTDWNAVPDQVWKTTPWQSTTMGLASKSSVPPEPGVYMMCARPPTAATMVEPFSDLLDVIYVGRSVNLRRRYTEHINTPSPKVRAAGLTYTDSIRFWFLRLPDHASRAAETLLIRCFGPPANDRPGETLHLQAGLAEIARSTQPMQEGNHG